MNKAFADIDPILFDYAQSYLGRFMPITRDELIELLQYCEIRKFDKRTIIVSEGEVDNYLNLVVKGFIRKYLRVKKRRSDTAIGNRRSCSTIRNLFFYQYTIDGGG